MTPAQCPKCGQSIPFATTLCPWCGCILEEETVEPTVLIPYGQINEAKPKKKSKKWIFILASIVLVLAAALVGGFLFLGGTGGLLRVKELNVGRWHVTSTTSYGNSYLATVTSDQKKPFVAVIGSRESDTLLPRFSFMEDGEGKLDCYAAADTDPADLYYPKGYTSCKPLSDKDATVSCQEREYTDFKYIQTTSCWVDYEISLNFKQNGVLLADIETLGNDRVYNTMIPVVEGKGRCSNYIELPYKTRGVETSVHPKAFLPFQKVRSDDCRVVKDLEIEREDGAYATYFSGKGVYAFDKVEEGLILYSITLTEGGSSANRGIASYCVAYLHKGTFSIPVFESMSENPVTPQYKIDILGYMTWKELGQ